MPQSENKKKFAFDRSGNYRIRANDFLDESWSERLAGLRITSSKIGDEKPVTVLVGQVRDQAELAGVLNALYELHLTLLSVEYLDGDWNFEVSGVGFQVSEGRRQRTEHRRKKTEVRGKTAKERR